jgi:hypothetical protein
VPHLVIQILLLLRRLLLFVPLSHHQTIAKANPKGLTIITREVALLSCAIYPPCTALLYTHTPVWIPAAVPG